MRKILILDDDTRVLAGLERALGDIWQWQIHMFDSPEAALESTQQHDYDVFLVDYRMPGMNGVDFLIQARKANPMAARLMLTGHADLQATIDAINRAGIDYYLTKPIEGDVLVAHIYRAMSLRDRSLAQQRLGKLAAARARPTV